jgi:hypothetical protein
MMNKNYKIKKKYLDLVSEDLHSLHLGKGDWMDKHKITEKMIEKSNSATSNLAFGGHPVHIQIPNDNNNISNWNDSHNIYDHIQVECGGEKGTLSYLIKVVETYKMTFGEGKRFLRQKDYLQVGCISGHLYEFENIINEVQPIIDKIIGKYQERNFYIRIESSRVADDKEVTRTHNNQFQDEMIEKGLRDLAKKIRWDGDQIVEYGEECFRKYL